MEQWANAARTTLAAAAAAGDVTITVASGSLFPPGPQFRLLVDAELMMVTAVAGPVWSVTRGIEGTTAAAHVLGAPVTQVVTAGSLSYLAQQIGIILGPEPAHTVYAGPPSGPAAIPTFRPLTGADIVSALIQLGGITATL